MECEICEDSPSGCAGCRETTNSEIYRLIDIEKEIVAQAHREIKRLLGELTHFYVVQREVTKDWVWNGGSVSKGTKRYFSGGVGLARKLDNARHFKSERDAEFVLECLLEKYKNNKRPQRWTVEKVCKGDKYE